jgi:uncharacterized protein YndB with AHSA1/START domain
MPTFDESISIAASREAVWRILSNVVNWPQWLSTMTRVEPLGAAPLAIGARYRVVQPKLVPATFEVTKLDPPSRFEWTARSPGVVAVADHVIEEQAAGLVLVRLQIVFSGLFAVPVSWFVGSITRRYLAQEVAALKREAERDATPSHR